MPWRNVTTHRSAFRPRDVALLPASVVNGGSTLTQDAKVSRMRPRGTTAAVGPARLAASGGRVRGAKVEENMLTHCSRFPVFASLLVVAAAGPACAKNQAPASTPTTTAAAASTPTARASHSAGAATRTDSSQPKSGASGGPAADQGQRDPEDAELVVGRDVVAHCPTLRLVRAHVSEFDPEMVWLAVLESIAECMSKDGAMSAQSIGVSGDEEHRRVVREILATHGVAPTRIVAQPMRGAAGAAECQAGSDCSKRIEITISAP